MDNKKAFYISCVLAIGLYVLLIFLFLFYLKQNDVKKFDAISKSTVLQLDIILDNPKENEKEIQIKSKVKSTKSEKIIKKSKSTSAKQRTNLKSLFANVKTKSTHIVKQKVMNIKESSIASRYKSKFEKIKKSKNVSINDLNNNKSRNNKNIVSNESKNESDPYYSKIYQLLSSRWQPTLFFDNLKAKVLITILHNGEFRYKFVQYSDNIGFDKQLTKFLSQESRTIYPINPNKKSTIIEITFQSKGE